MQKTILNEHKIKTEQEYFELIIEKCTEDKTVGIDLFLALNKADKKAALRHMAKKAADNQHSSKEALSALIDCINSL